MLLNRFLCSCPVLLITITALPQITPQSTELWKPEPPVVTPGKTNSDVPSDAILLFDGTSAGKWQHRNGNDANWIVAEKAMTVKPGTGGIFSKQKFGDCQMHIEWRTPSEIKGDGQDRGNSGIYFMSRYEVQVLDNYNNKTYVNGQAGSIYKQHIPLVNACKPPGEWQTYDIIFTAPRFGVNDRVIEPARITVLQNGVLVQNNVTIWGTTDHIGIPKYEKHDAKEPIMLQDHGNPTSYRNIWIREL